MAIALLAAAYWILYAGAKLVGGFADRRLRRAAVRPAIDLLALWIMTAGALRSAMAIIYATRPATDAIVGDFVRILKERGDYDSSLIVLTADHGLRPEAAAAWERLDAEAFIPEKHVPLIVKYPHQRRRADGHAILTTAQLHPLFADFLNHPEWVVQ